MGLTMRRSQAITSLLWLGLVAPGLAHAAQWTICDFEVKRLRADRSDWGIAVVIISKKKTNSLTCPNPGDQLRFTPETADYQSALPRKLWPKMNQRAKLRYRYLDGECKERGPCRIEHHAIMGTR